MFRPVVLTLVLGMTAFSSSAGTATIGVVASEAEGDGEPRTMTGWFSDAQCATSRVAKGIIAPNNPDCVKKCLNEGATPVFISEQAKALFEVRDHPSVLADVGFYVEVVGTVDKSGKALSITSVKRLEEQGPTCQLPKKKPTAGASRSSGV
jgi:hypothetical protein